MIRILPVLLALTLALPGIVEAQSVLARGGLGIPSEPLDARTRALGGVGVGLTGWALQPTDPAAAAGIRLPTIAATFQPGTASVEGGENAGHTRFPILGVSYPFGANTFFLTFNSYMDSEWEVRAPVLLDLADREVEGEDIFRSDGGMGQVRLGWARRLTDAWAVGISAGQLTGSLDRSFTRELDPEEIGSDVSSFRRQGRWTASGSVVSGSVSWSPTDLIRIGAGLAWTDQLRLDPSGDTEGDRRSYTLPTEYRVGGTLTLSPRLALALGVTWADWSEMNGELEEGGTRGETLTWGGGVEWTGGSVLGRPFPLRLGYREQELPFLYDGEAGSESAWTGGFGVNLADFEDVPVARLEVGFQRGTRNAGPLSEDFWRTTVSLRLAGG